MKKCPNRTAVFYQRDAMSRFPVNHAARREVAAIQRKYIPPEDKDRREIRLKRRAAWRSMRRSRLQNIMNRYQGIPLRRRK